MSTESYVFSGLQETVGYAGGPGHLSNRVEYTTQEMRIHAFSGGKDRGPCIQISVGHEHIQLSVEVAKDMIAQLIKLL